MHVFSFCLFLLVLVSAFQYMQKTFISATFGRVMYSLSFVLLSVSKIKEKLWVAFCEIFVSCEPEKSELKLGSDQEHIVESFEITSCQHVYS